MNRFFPLFALLVLSACGSDVKTTTVRNSAGETVTIVKDPGSAVVSATVTSSARPTTGEPWPTDTPGFAPAYPGALVTTVGANTGNGSTGSIITFNTPDSPTAVVAFYQAQAKKAGLARIAALSTEQSTLFSAGDPGSGRALTIQAAAKGDHTAAALTFSRARGQS